jgi:carbonic anhydrase/acetyltransferase-like protein (isoleucine patch superfamily)
VLHTTPQNPTTVGNDCVIGHIVHLEGCTIEDNALVGNGSVVLHRAIVRSGSLVGSNAVVPNDFEVPSGAMALGVPAVLKLDRVKPGMISNGVAAYVARAERYGREMRRVG